MNIVITLPHELIQAILDGKKTVEVRTRIPKDFHKECDVVYVVEKGTKTCPLYFSIWNFEEFYDCGHAFLAAEDKACVPKRELSNYLQDCFFPVLWHIGRVCPIVDISYEYKMLGIYRNPQCYCYTDLDVTSVYTQKGFWSKDVPENILYLVYKPDKHFDYFIEFAAAGAPMSWEDYCRTYGIPHNCRGIQL